MFLEFCVTVFTHEVVVTYPLQPLLTAWSNAPKLFFFFFCPNRMLETSLLEICTTTKALSSVNDFLSHSSPKTSSHWPRGAEADLWATAWSKPELRSICLLSNVQIGEIPPRCLALWCWISLPFQSHSCSWMDAEFLFWRMGTKTREFLCQYDANVIPLIVSNWLN